MTKEEYKKIVGRRVKARREQLGMSQVELAQKMGYKSNTSISKIEAGRDDMKQAVIARLCAALDCRPSDILDGPTGRDIQVMDVNSGLLDGRIRVTLPENLIIFNNEEYKLSPEELGQLKAYADFLISRRG